MIKQGKKLQHGANTVASFIPELRVSSTPYSHPSKTRVTQAHAHTQLQSREISDVNRII